ncbi:hypothetical protein [Bacillus massiliglaciei]|uniref:hypothetical protein n=1 Tax=Bacillus massiliglaciei TaxID=1816693 RepID=UPI0018FE2058|nr:hypothetical protein [Bacillus massiliglaciei]
MLDRTNTNLGDFLEVDLAAIKEKLEYVASWKSGKGIEAFLTAMENYFAFYSQYIQAIRDIEMDISEAKKNINYALDQVNWQNND